MIYRRCSFCRQLIDLNNSDELAHHARMGHKPMPGIPDDGLETIPLDFSPPKPRSLGDPPPEPWAPKREPLPYKTMRPKRRKKRDFLAHPGGSWKPKNFD